MKEITKELIMKDAKIEFACIAHSVSMLLGVGTTLLPLITIGEFNRNAILSMLFLFVCFGVLFGFYFGLRLLMRDIYMLKCIKRGQVAVDKDILVDKEHVNSREDENLECLLLFEKYSAKTGMGIIRPRTMYEKVKKDEEFYLVYVGKKAEPVLVYSANEYFFNGTLN